jgi:hypothetical protein
MQSTLLTPVQASMTDDVSPAALVSKLFLNVLTRTRAVRECIVVCRAARSGKWNPDILHSDLTVLSLYSN